MKSMAEIPIPATTITNEQYIQNARQLMMSVLLQSVKDYCKSTSESIKNAIIKDLKSRHMDFLTDGLSIITAEQLELHPDEIRERMRNNNYDML